jgi:peptidase M48 ste24p
LYTKLGLILVRHSMRKQEYEADKFAYDLGYGEQLRDALTQLQDTNEAPKKFAANLMSTHPDIFSRIDKLNMYLFQNDRTENYNSYENEQANGTENYNFYENTQTNSAENYNFYENTQTRNTSNENSKNPYKILLPFLYILIACLAGYIFSKMNNNTVAIKHTIPNSSREQVTEQNNTEKNNNKTQLEDNNQTNTNSQDISDINLANKDFSGFSEQPSQNMTDLENINYLASNLPSADFLRANFSSEELALLRNTIYAKYNRRFQTPKYSSYFSRKTWYRGEYNEVSERNFSQDEFDLLNNILMAEGKSTLSR